MIHKMCRRPIFVTGIGTDVGKTISSAVIVRALAADYWKPVQTGASSDSDRMTIQRLVESQEIEILPEAVALPEPVSPHDAAQRNGVKITIQGILSHPPFVHRSSPRPLVIEGAGGLLVPLNERELIIDLIVALDAHVVIVSRNYLGSINHTLLTVEAAQKRGLRIVGILFNGPATPATEEVISNLSGLPSLGRIEWADQLSTSFVAETALQLGPVLCKRVLSCEQGVCQSSLPHNV